MLSRDQADERIAEHYVEDWENEARARAAKLRGKAKKVTDALLEGWGYTYSRKPEEREEVERRRLEAATALDEATPKVLRSVMEACHPTLAPSLVNWWNWAKSNQRMRNGQLFPRRPDLTRDTRFINLSGLIQNFGGYPADGPWIAEWAGYRSYYQRDTVADLLLACVEHGPDGDEVYQTLLQTIRGEHSFAVMGDHVLSVLTRASRAEGWQLVEGALVAARRQEGLRASILGCVSDAHPDAFKRLLKILVDENMLRFGAVLTAVGQWVGVATSAEDEKAAAEWLQTLIEVSDMTSEEILQTDSAADFELSLVWLARRDSDVAFEIASEVIGQPDRESEFRMLAGQWLKRSGIPEANAVLESLIDDPDPAICALVIELLRFSRIPRPSVFDATERLLERWPDKPIVFNYSALSPSKARYERRLAAWSLLSNRGDLPFARLVPWLDELIALTGSDLISYLGKREQLEPAERQLLVDLTGHRNKGIRLSALEVLNKGPLQTGEAEAIELLLCKKTESVRRVAIGVLAAQDPTEIAASVGRLWSGSDLLSANQLSKSAAAELLSLSESDEAVSALANELLGQDPSEEQSTFLRTAAGTPDDDEAQNPRFGLFVDADRSPSIQPTMPTGLADLRSGNAAGLLSALDELIDGHLDVEVTIADRRGESRQVLFGELNAYPSPFATHGRHVGKTDKAKRPLGQILDDWWDQHRERHHDEDGLVLLRAHILLENSYYSERTGRFLRPPSYTVTMLDGIEPVMLRHGRKLPGILDWFLAPTISRTEPEQLLKLMQGECSFVTAEDMQTTVPPEDPDNDLEWRLHDFRRAVPWSPWRSRLFAYRQFLDADSDDEQLAEIYRLFRWLAQPLPESVPSPVEPEILFAAHHRGFATDADVFDELLGLSARQPHAGYRSSNDMLRRLTAHDRTGPLEQYPKAVAVADRIRERVLEIELQRGELPTAATHYVRSLGCIEGAERVFDVLSLLGSDDLVRGWTSHESKTGMASSLLRNSFPLPEDSGRDLKRLAKERDVGTKRLVELAIYAPQWATLVEDATSWRGLADGVWWLHAHTKDRQWSVGAEVRDTWQSTIAQLTSLTPEDLMDGAVDVDWFKRFHSVLGPKRWSVVYEASKLSSSGLGHNRAKLFADAMLGELDAEKVVGRIEQKRHQDSVRALGLLPLPKAKRRRNEEMIRRYYAIRAFEKGSSKFGNQRKASERLAARVGLDNLARTAGYADPQRFAWAMEEAGIADLKKGPVVLAVDDVTITLAIDVEGVAAIAVDRSGRPLKNVPVKLRKNPDVVAVRARQSELASQVKRVRASLEQAMVRADHFTEVELASLIEHPIVGPMLKLLVIVDRRGSLAMATTDGFIGQTGRRRKLQEPLRVAHASDLLSSGEWPKWQAMIVDDEKRQPFKQAFRELYVPTAVERDQNFSKRYAGHQVQPSQARALLGGRGWYHNPDSGMFSATNHAAEIVSHLALGIELFGSHSGELPEVGDIAFHHRTSGERLAIADVPIHVFSETMRDVDLVVSVAHAGGVDPETSQSTVEMRIALARETARVLRLENVDFTETHALISGTVSSYSLHLGSGIAHRRAGSALAIRAAPSQRRGRIFLPFADDDPKTAEIMSKLLLLAKDDEIQDPNILRQIV